MIDIVVTLVFSIVMLLFMAFPAIKIVEFIDTKVSLSQNSKNILIIFITIFLSLLVGLFLRYF